MSASKIAIKKYANRRLYDMTNSVYITLADLAEIVKSGQSVTVSDAKTGEDLTTNTLLHILTEQHQEGHETLSAKTLARLISCAADNKSAAMAAHLDKAIDALDDSATDRSDIDQIKEALQTLTHAVQRLDSD